MTLSDEIRSQPLLLVGCGGIGCEVIKNLLLIGFNNIKMIDLDTIDVSNLNRQFLFNKTHINQSKSIVSAKIATSLFAHDKDSNLNVEPIHGSILNAEYDVDFFKSFSLVINALDNRQARSHVNRMCLAADVPLIESGTEGYLGQTFVIKKNITSCYECSGPKADQKTYASCTIRNTPSLPIHCIVWGKHLFNQLFGEDDPDNDVSPDINDPELGGSNNQEKKDVNASSTRKWAELNNYDPILIFDKLFKLDIEYLHKMDKLWQNRVRPITINHEELSSIVLDKDTNTEQNNLLEDQKLLSLKECFEMFTSSLNQLKSRLKDEQFLVWDKDDEPALDFVTAVSNLRSHCFHIERKSKYDVKSMAGNIIPAISSTNSIIGGIMVLQIMNLLNSLFKLSDEQKLDKNEINNLYKEKTKHVFLKKVGERPGNLIAAYDNFEQNPKCLVCNTKNVPEIELSLNLDQVTMSDFVEQFLYKKLNFVCPDIQLDNQPTIIWSKDDFDEYSEDEKTIFKTKVLSEYSLIKNKVRLKVYDLLQNLTVIITFINEVFNPNEFDGLFYKMNILNHAEPETEPKNNEEIKNNNSNEKIILETDLESSNEITEIIDSNEEQKNGLIDQQPNENNHQASMNQDINKSNQESTNNHKLSENQSNKNNQFHTNDDIEIIDLDNDVCELKEIYKSKSNKTFDQDCEILDDDDDDLKMIEIKEKRKIIDLEGFEDQHNSKKLKINNSGS